MGVSVDGFRKLALALPETGESAHMGHPDFRVHGRIFATLHPDGKSGGVKLTPEQQPHFVRQYPGVFLPAAGAWGLQGFTMILLAAADEETVGEALTLARQNVVDKKAESKRSSPARKPRQKPPSSARKRRPSK